MRYKFRAWDSKTEEMTDDVTLYSNGWIGCVFTSGHEEKYEPGCEHINVRQWTGLKDRNDKEIYEGDIVQFETKKLNGHPHLVKHKVSFHFGVYKCGLYHDLNEVTPNCEVIGNIYEMGGCGAMRQRKFQAWHEDAKEMLDEYFPGEVFMWARQGQPLKIREWTGMHDKRETPIFEGDIIDFSVFDHNGSDTQYRGVVKFSSGQWEVWNSVDSEYYGSDGAFMLYWVHQQDDGIEVIGNQFQHTELINSYQE